MKFSPPIKTILVLLLWLACIYKLYVDFDREYLFDSLIHNALIIIASTLSAFAINSDYSQYRQQKKVSSFFSSLTAILCIAGLLLITYLLKQQDQTRTIYYAVRNTGGLGQITLDFRENNTYKLGRHHFMSANYQRGRYTIKDSIIYLDKSYTEEQIMSDRFLFKENPNYDTTKKGNVLKMLFGAPEDDVKAKTVLYQITHNGQTIDSAISFRLVQRPFN
ncbi:MAG: hypothetical protein JST34_15720 [Bacteroidetes bacterium]|nr:hypothetical protein [Bacteroidota bacterium]